VVAAKNIKNAAVRRTDEWDYRILCATFFYCASLMFRLKSHFMIKELLMEDCQ